MIDPRSLIDLTLPITRDMLLYPGDSPPEIRRLSSLSAGDPLTASELRIGCHVGTHVDAPSHFVRGGLQLNDLDPRHFIGPAVVIDIPHSLRITPEDLSPFPIPEKRHVLLKTANSHLLQRNVFDPSHVYVTPQAIDYLLEFEPRSIGFDYYSLDPPSASCFPAHTKLAKRNLPAFVCLNLAVVAPGEYLFLSFPLKLEVEGFPVRAFLSAFRR